MKGKNTEKELKKAKRELSIETLIANNRYKQIFILND